MEQNSSKRYAVVSFPDEEDEGLFIISTKWLIHNKSEDEYYCMWPPYKTDARIKNAVLEEETPTSAWQKSPAKLLKKCKSYAGGESFINAIMLVTKGRSRSEKRDHREKRDHSEKRDSSSKHKKRSSSSKRIKLEVVSPVSSPAPCDSSSSSSEDSDTGVICDQSTAETDEPLNVGIPSTSRLTTVPNASAYQFLLESTPVLPQVLEVTGSEVYDPNGSLEGWKTQVLKALSELKKKLDKQYLLLQELIARHPSSVATVPSAIDLDDPLKHLPKLPVESVEELNNFEEFLKHPVSFNYAVKQFSTVGGVDVSMTTRRILKKIMSNELACQYNWLGRHQKRRFKDLRASSVIACAINLNQHLGHPPALVVENIIKDWLKHATFRHKYSMNKSALQLKNNPNVF